MSAYINSLSKAPAGARASCGGKCGALADLARAGFVVTEGLCICFGAYERFLAASNLRVRIQFELGRKKFEQMRWEEMWDLSLRIRNLFARQAMPEDLRREFERELAVFGDSAVVVRSSAAGEDSGERSFAGLHESYVNVRGTESILNHVKLVWASLWSDRALLYRRELGLSPDRSVMGVVVQRLTAGEVSGVAFSRRPDGIPGTQHEGAMLIEAVYGLNQGLVDGTVEPDHWELDRTSGAVLFHRPAQRLNSMRPGAEGLKLVGLDKAHAARPPLDAAGLVAVREMALRAEEFFAAPQDVEWTLAGGRLYVLQSRPITTLRKAPEEDQRAWYLTLTRSFDNLKMLRRRIEEEIIPGMDSEARRFKAGRLDMLSDAELAAEIERREESLNRWTKAYWADCIPFAHGMRLFGQVYSDAVKPRDPYEFLELLTGQATLGLQRNRMLEDMAEAVREEPDLARLLRDDKDLEAFPQFRTMLDTFLEKYAAISRAGAEEPPPAGARSKVIGLVLEMAGSSVAAHEHKGQEAVRGGIGPKPPELHGPGPEPPGLEGAPSAEPREAGRRRAAGKDPAKLEKDFLARFTGPQRRFAGELLDLARASYRWRDDDNIYLARIEAAVAAALDHGRRRVGTRLAMAAGGLGADEVRRALRDPGYRAETDGPATPAPVQAPARTRRVSPRQLTGLPAGPGIGTGPARVVLGTEDLYAFKAGEVMVCDAIEPEMTLVVPLAAGIVERRGGMLIHGAIVAREYGIPCVTGVPDAASLIKNGDRVTVDGYLGIVIISEESKQRDVDSV